MGTFVTSSNGSEGLHKLFTVNAFPIIASLTEKEKEHTNAEMAIVYAWPISTISQVFYRFGFDKNVLSTWVRDEANFFITQVVGLDKLPQHSQMLVYDKIGQLFFSFLSAIDKFVVKTFEGMEPSKVVQEFYNEQYTQLIPPSSAKIKKEALGVYTTALFLETLKAVLQSVPENLKMPHINCNS